MIAIHLNPYFASPQLSLSAKNVNEFCDNELEDSCGLVTCKKKRLFIKQYYWGVGEGLMKGQICLDTLFVFKPSQNFIYDSSQ